MKILKITLLFIFIIFYSFAQKKDTIYFDVDWKKTDKKHHQFYRILPFKTLGDFSLFADYHKGGKIQMQAYLLTKDLKDGNTREYKGAVYWYNKSGADDSEAMHNTSGINTTLLYYHHNGAIWKKVPYKNGVEGIPIIYDDKGRLRNAPTINKSEEIYHWFDTPKIAHKIEYREDGDVFKEEIYSKNGVLLKTYKESDYVEKQFKMGVYYKKITENNFVVGFDTIVHKGAHRKVFTMENVLFFNYKTNAFITKKNGKTQHINFELYRDQSGKTIKFELLESSQNSKYKEKIISVKNIKKQSPEKLLKNLSQKQWEYSYSEKDPYSDNSTDHKEVLRLYNESLFVDFAQSNTRPTQRFRTYYLKNDDDLIPWELSNINFYTINIVMLNGNTPIVALSNNYGFQYYIIPLKDGSFFKYKTNNKEECKNISTNEDIEIALLNSMHTKQYYGKKIIKNKSYLTNQFNEVLIDEPYDLIERVHQYIICRNRKKIDIYNSKLEKLPLGNIQEAYFDRNSIQVLSKGSIFFVNALWQKSKRQESISRSVYRTTTFVIDHTLKNQPKIIINERESGRHGSHHYSKTIPLPNLKNKKKITFLNQEKQIKYHNAEMQGNRTQLLLVKNNSKYGLYSFDIKKLKNDAKELLPFEYDSIKQDESIIILKKDRKYGIYEDEKGLVYKSFGEVNVNFIKYKKPNGEKGWLDINTFEEYKD